MEITAEAADGPEQAIGRSEQRLRLPMLAVGILALAGRMVGPGTTRGLTRQAREVAAEPVVVLALVLGHGA